LSDEAKVGRTVAMQNLYSINRGIHMVNGRYCRM